jgi:hypothetical protein
MNLVRVTTVAVEKQKALNNMCVCVCVCILLALVIRHAKCLRLITLQSVSLVLHVSTFS